jgi:hypothetical protein
MKPIRQRERSTTYCDLCQGIAPILIKSPRDFLAAQAFVVVLALAILVLALLSGDRSP